MTNKTYFMMKIGLLTVLTIAVIAILVFLITDKSHYYLKWNVKKEQNIIYDKTYPNMNFQQINIDVETTDVIIKPSQDQQIHIVVYGKKEEKVSVDMKEEQLYITKEEKNNLCFGICFDAKEEMIIYLPTDFQSAFAIQTKSGDIEVDDFEHMTLIAKTTSGDMKMKKVKQLIGNTESGSVEIQEVEHIIFNTNSGDIDINSVLTSVQLKTESGDIEIEQFQIKEDSKVETSSGDIEISSVTDVYIDASSKSGDIEIKGNNHFSNLTLKIETKSGDIEIR